MFKKLPVMVLVLMMFAGCGGGIREEGSELARSKPLLALIGGTLIDGNGGAPLRDAIVLINGDRIIEVGDRSRVVVPPGAKVIETTGKYILPGLIDAHVHYESWMGELFLAHGVTTVKDLGNDVAWIASVSDAINDGITRGPRVFYVGNALDAPPPSRDHHVGIDNRETARRAVKILHGRGALAIKVREKITPELLEAVVEEAHALGIPVTGHLARTNAREAALAGIDGLEHCSGVVEATSPHLHRPEPGLDEMRRHIAGLKAFSLIDQGKTEELARLLVEERVALIPTMSNWWRMASERRGQFGSEDAEYARRSDLAYIPDHIRQFLATSAVFDIEDAQDLAEIKSGFEQLTSLLRLHYRLGGKIQAGSDTLLSVPGLSLQRELIMLVDAGFTPMEAITIGTRDNARFLGKGEDLGAISPGKLADIIVVAADPLRDISNLRQIETVIKGGQVMYHTDYSPTPKPKTRPLWIELQLLRGNPGNQQ